MTIKVLKMATSLLLLIAILDSLPHLGDATHAYWHVGHGTSRQLGQAGWDGLIPDKLDGIPRETHNSGAKKNSVGLKGSQGETRNPASGERVESCWGRILAKAVIGFQTLTMQNLD